MDASFGWSPPSRDEPDIRKDNFYAASLDSARMTVDHVEQPFGGGGLLRNLLRRSLPPWAQEIDCKSWAQILLKFVLGHPAVTCVIPGTGQPEHMVDNVSAGVGRVPDAALRARMIDSL
jgi:diketogulonate reductase-like aldo/keto reductase